MKLGSQFLFGLALVCASGLAAQGTPYSGNYEIPTTEAGAGGLLDDSIAQMSRHIQAQEAESAFSPSDYRIIFDFGTATNEITGNGLFTDSGVTGTEFDFQDTLGLEEEDETRFGVQLYLDWFRLDLAYSDFSFAGNETLATALTFGGRTFDVNTNVVTDFDAKYYRAYLGFTPFRFKDMIELGFGLSLHVVDSTVTLTGTEAITTASITEQEDVPLPAATFSLHGGVYLEYISIEPQFGIGVIPEVSGVEATIIDASLTIRVHPLDWLSIGAKAGYFSSDITADIDDEFEGDFEISQTHIAGVIGFEF